MLWHGAAFAPTVHCATIFTSPELLFTQANVWPTTSALAKVCPMVCQPVGNGPPTKPPKNVFTETITGSKFAPEL